MAHKVKSVMEMSPWVNGGGQSLEDFFWMSQEVFQNAANDYKFTT
jgi:hypothetical protein